MPKFTITYTIQKQVPPKQILVDFDSEDATLDIAVRAVMHNEFPHLFFPFREHDRNSAEDVLRMYEITDIEITHTKPGRFSSLKPSD